MTPIGFCEECGAELEAGAKFCEKCGRPVVIESEPTVAAPSAGIPPSPPPASNQVVPPRLQSLPQPIPVPQATSTQVASSLPPSPQLPAKKTGSKFILIIIVCLVGLCVLLVIALGLGWFTAKTGTVNIGFSNTPIPEATQTKENPTAAPTSTAIPTEIPKPGVSKYLSRIGTFLGTYVTEFEKFGTLFDKADVQIFKDLTWRNDIYSAFDRVIEAAGNVANESAPVEYETFKSNFTKAYEEFKAAKPYLHNGIDNIDVDSLNSFTDHLKKANEYIDKAKASMPQSGIVPTKVLSVNKSQYLTKVVTLLEEFNAELKIFSSSMGSVTETSFTDEAWKKDVFDSLDRIIKKSNDLAIEPCPTEYQVFKTNMEKAHAEYEAGRPDLHTGIDDMDVSALSTFTEHLVKAKGYVDLANSAFRKSKSDGSTTGAIPETTTGQGGARDLSGFNDDFSSTINTWKIVSDAGNGTAVVENGELNLTVTKPDKYLSVQVPWYLTKPVTDVTLSVTATVRTPEMGYFGLFCRALDKNNFYMISIRPKASGGGEYRFYKNLNGKISYLNEWEYTTVLYGGEIPEKVTFSCRGTNLRLEVNGKLVDEVTDSDIKSGSAHLFALSKSDVTADNPFRISFDNFKAAMP